MTDETDGSLLARCGAGKDNAFEQLVRHHGPAIIGYLNRILGDSTAAEDVLQQTMLAAFRHASSFRGIGSTRGWLFAIVRNEARRSQRKHARKICSQGLLELGVAAGWGSDDPESLATLAGRRALLHEMIASPTDHGISSREQKFIDNESFSRTHASRERESTRS